MARFRVFLYVNVLLITRENACATIMLKINFLYFVIQLWTLAASLIIRKNLAVTKNSNTIYIGY